MNIESELKKEGIEVISQIDALVVNSIIKSVARRISESFPSMELDENLLFDKLSNISMFKAKIPEGMAEASYFYKNSSIYFNENIEYDDIEEFAIHECIHHLQEIKDENNVLKRMGLCYYNKKSKPYGLALNEAGVQYTSSWIIGIDPDYEKYYDITLYTPSPSYYPLECSLLNELIYFTGNDVLFKSILFSSDDFKNKIIEISSESTYVEILNYFDKLLEAEENVIKLNSKINKLADGSDKFKKLSNKLYKSRKNVTNIFLEIQNLIITNFINSSSELENFKNECHIIDFENNENSIVILPKNPIFSIFAKILNIVKQIRQEH